MATHLELDSGIVVTRFFAKGEHRVQLNLKTGANQTVSLDAAKELRDALTSLLAEAKPPRGSYCTQCGGLNCTKAEDHW